MTGCPGWYAMVPVLHVTNLMSRGQNINWSHFKLIMPTKMIGSQTSLWYMYNTHYLDNFIICDLHHSSQCSDYLPILHWECHKIPYGYCQVGGTYHAIPRIVIDTISCLLVYRDMKLCSLKDHDHPHAYSTMLARWCDKVNHSIHRTSYMQY